MCSHDFPMIYGTLPPPRDVFSFAQELFGFLIDFQEIFHGLWHR